MINLTKRDDGSHESPDDPGERCYGGVAKRISITEEECDLLASLLAGRCVLEIGTGLGISTKAIAKTSAYIYTFDTDPWVIENVHPQLECQYIHCLSDRASPVPPIDAAFIDGYHDKNAVREDIEFCRRLGARLIILHDIKAPAVMETAKEFGQVAIYDTHWGIGVLCL